jgi:hypothetical protein
VSRSPPFEPRKIISVQFLSPRLRIRRGSISGRPGCQKRGRRNRHDASTIRTLASLGPTLRGNLQPASAGAVEAIVAVISLTRIFRLNLRPPQTDSGPAFRTVDPVRTIGLNFDFLAAPASYASHGKDPMLITRPQRAVARTSKWSSLNCFNSPALQATCPVPLPGASALQE